VIDRETIERNETIVGVTERSKGFSGHLADAWTHAIEATDAQFSIYLLKATRLIVIAMFCGVAIVGLSALAGYGFWLLDGCLAYALSQPSMPVWSAPLIRGSVYLGAPLAALLYIWKTMVGCDAKPGAGASAAATAPRAGERHATV
jgi:hypothetical protein